MRNGKGDGNGAPRERPGDAMLELAAEVRRDDEWDDWEESTVRTLIVEDRRPPQPSSPDTGYAGVAKAAVDKMPASHLLIVALAVAVAAALVAGRKLGVW